MADGKIADVAVLERMDTIEFYDIYSAWKKRHEAIIEANKQS